MADKVLPSLSDLSKVFTSILNGTFCKELDKFSDDELRPFLPFLICNAFQNKSGDSDQSNLLARLSAYPEGNRISRIFSFNFQEIEANLSTKIAAQSYILADDMTKMHMIVRQFGQVPPEDVMTIITDDNVADVSLLFAIAYIHMPSLFPIDKTVLRLLSMNRKTDFIIGILLNAPELLYPIISILIGLQVSDECVKGRQKIVILGQLMTLCPSIRMSVLDDMITSKKDCLPAVRLACSHLNDEEIVSFLLPLLINKSSLLSNSITKSSARVTLTKLHERLIAICQHRIESSSTEPDADLVQCLVILQLHCSHKMSPEQLSVFCGYICRCDVTDEKYLCLALACVLSVHSLTTPPTQLSLVSQTTDPRIVTFLEWLSNFANNEERKVLIPFIVNIGICLLAPRGDQLKHLLSEYLKVKVSIHPRHHNVLKSLFLTHCLSEVELAERCTTQPVTTSLSASTSGRLPIHSAVELLKMGAFNHNDTTFGIWLQKQLETCTIPIHPLIPEVVERFAVEAARHKMHGLSPEFVQQVFSGGLLDSSMLPVRILVLLFLLAYRSQLDAMGSSAVDLHGIEIYSLIPIRYIISVVECKGKDLGAARPSLMKFVTDLFPYMLPTVDSVLVAKTGRNGVRISQTVQEVNVRIQKGEIAAVTKEIEIAPISDLVRLLPSVVTCFLTTLNDKMTVSLVESVMVIWSRLENIVPRMLYENTCMESLGALVSSNVTLAKVYEYPCLLFRADSRLFSSPPHFRCFIRMLDFFVSASRNQLMRSVHAANANLTDAERMDRDSLSSALDHTQASLLVQLLIEVSDPVRMKDCPTDSSLLMTRRLIRKIACEYIHHLFIQDKNIMKLVFFQTIPLHMVPLVVEDIPSMFVARDFVQEMLTLPDLNRRIFAVCLMVHVSKKFRIAASCVTVELILDVLHSLLKYAESSVNVQMFLKIVPTIAQISTIFPQLSGDVSALLLHIHSVLKSKISLQPLFIDCGSKEMKLMKQIESSLSKDLFTA